MGNNNQYSHLPFLISEGGTNCHSDAKRAEKIRLIENNKKNTCGNASLIPPYVLEARESKGVVENQPSPHPSPIGEGVSNSHTELVSGSHQILKRRGKSDVQHDGNFPKFYLLILM